MPESKEFIAHYGEPETADVYYRTCTGFICRHGSKQAKELKDRTQEIKDGDDLCLVTIESVVYLDDPVESLSDLVLQL